MGVFTPDTSGLGNLSRSVITAAKPPAMPVKKAPQSVVKECFCIVGAFWWSVRIITIGAESETSRVNRKPNTRSAEFYDVNKLRFAHLGFCTTCGQIEK